MYGSRGMSRDTAMEFVGDVIIRLMERSRSVRGRFFCPIITWMYGSVLCYLVEHPAVILQAFLVLQIILEEVVLGSQPVDAGREAQLPKKTEICLRRDSDSEKNESHSTVGDEMTKRYTDTALRTEWYASLMVRN